MSEGATEIINAGLNGMGLAPIKSLDDPRDPVERRCVGSWELALKSVIRSAMPRSARVTEKLMRSDDVLEGAALPYVYLLPTSYEQLDQVEPECGYSVGVLAQGDAPGRKALFSNHDGPLTVHFYSSKFPHLLDADTILAAGAMLATLIGRQNQSSAEHDRLLQRAQRFELRILGGDARQGYADKAPIASSAIDAFHRGGGRTEY